MRVRLKPVHDGKKVGDRGIGVVADPWNLKLKPAKLKGDPFLRRCEDQYCPLGTLGYVSSQKDRG